ncbi:OmpH family outer membrane protein [Yoonia sp. 2307UL14-13]|uniref:OmpH family outer membrane protein n=1 Tax=Yoonia sp. 2307UL14-13 TaxID=3126506 RepID=UPI00309D6825
MRIWTAILIWLAAAVAAPAQETPPQVLIIDSDRLYAETLYGRRLEAELAAEISAVQDENDRIAETLREEELNLTDRRPDMDPEAFREEARAFDEKVQEVRTSRDAKAVELQAKRAAARARFEEQVQGIVANVMLERGAVMVMEQRNVVLSVRTVNITDDVIVRVDAQLGDGSQ